MLDIREGRVSRFSLESVLPHSTEKIRRGTHLFFRKLLVSENFMGKRGRGREGLSQFYVEKFLSHKTAKFRR